MNHQPRGRIKQFQGISPFLYNDTYLAHTGFTIRRPDLHDELIHSYDGIHWGREASARAIYCGRQATRVSREAAGADRQSAESRRR
jgi:hypothetical protein